MTKPVRVVAKSEYPVMFYENVNGVLTIGRLEFLHDKPFAVRVTQDLDSRSSVFIPIEAWDELVRLVEEGRKSL